MNSSPSEPFSPFPIARYWSAAGSSENSSGETRTVRCELCPHECRIAPGKRGQCRIRLNAAGQLTAPFYGRFTSLAVDPIEKKPLYHFFPASPVLSIGTAGCNLSCRFCQNWSISQTELDPLALSSITPEDFAALAEKRGAPSVAFTYNEPSIWAEFVIDAAKECRRRRIRTVAVTNGLIRGRAREEFYDVMDAVNIDLKAFTNEFYHGLCGGGLESVQETIRYVAKETGVWMELTNLLVPTQNDSPDETKRMVDWLLETVGDEVPLHFSAFFPTYQLTEIPRTPPETLYAALETAHRRGIRYAYVGNIGGDRGHSTLCPHCGETVIQRNGFRASNRLVPEFPPPPPTESADGGYSLDGAIFRSTVGGYRWTAPPVPNGRSGNLPAKQVDSSPQKENHGCCSRCGTVIPGRFF